MKTRKDYEAELYLLESKVSAQMGKVQRAYSRLKKLWDRRKVVARAIAQLREDEHAKRQARRSKAKGADPLQGDAPGIDALLGSP